MRIKVALMAAALAACSTLAPGGAAAQPPPPADGWWGCYRPAPGALLCSYGPEYSWNVLVETPHSASLPMVSSD